MLQLSIRIPLSVYQILQSLNLKLDKVERLRARAANDTTRAQINNIPEKSHVIIIIINKQGQMISRMRVLIIQAK